MYPPNLNVPLPDPSQLAPEQTLQPDPMQKALSLITPLFAIGTAMGGSPQAGAAFLHGAHQTMQRRDQEQQVKQHQQQQVMLQQQQLAAQQAQHEAVRQQAIEQAKQKLVMDTATQAKGLTRDQYEQLIAQNEGIGASFLGMRPNSIRSAVPWMAPNANDVMAKAGAAFLKNPANAQAIEQGKLDGMIEVDVQGDGKPIKVPVKDVLAASGVQLDPQTGAPLVLPKEAKTSGIQLDDEAFLGKVAQFEAEKGRKATPAERGLIAIQTKRALEKPPAATAGAADDTDTLAQMLVDGRALPSMLSKRGSTYNATLARANKLSLAQTGRPVNLAKLQIDYEGAKRFVASLNGPNMIRFKGLAGSVINTIDEVKRLGDELQQGGIQRWNAAKRGSILQLYGNTPQSEAAAEYLAAISTLKEEFASLVQGGFAPTEGAFQLANQQVNGDFGAKDLNASLGEVQRLINYRMGAFNELRPQGLGGDSSVDHFGDQTPPSDAGAIVWGFDANGKLVRKK
jgi:hypothetical protein